EGIELEQYEDLVNCLDTIQLAQMKDRWSWSLTGNGVESTSHLLFSYSMARDVLAKMNMWWDIPFPDFHSYDDWLLWLSNLCLCRKIKNVLEGVFMWRGGRFGTFVINSSLVQAVLEERRCLMILWRNLIIGVPIGVNPNLTG
ncbi:hypothetical protein Tco_0511248, partial [Tanacetum coccineum]